MTNPIKNYEACVPMQEMSTKKKIKVIMEGGKITWSNP